MKKLLTIMLALVMSLSIATVFTACEDELVLEPTPAPHTHAYATEWTSDDTHHWHKATCEHTEEISEKAEHTYGADGKCSVCGIEKGHKHTYEIVWSGDDMHHWKKATCEHSEEVAEKAEHTYGTDDKCTDCGMLKPYAGRVNEEQWLSNFDKFENMINVRVANVQESSRNNEVYKTETYVLELNGNKWREGYSSSLQVYNETIINKTGANSYEVYNRDDLNDKFKKLTKQSETQPYVDDAEAKINLLVMIGELGEDKFAQATFDQIQKVYTVNLENITFEGEEGRDVIYTLSFINGDLKTIKVSGYILDGDKTISFNYSYEFSGIQVTIPSENMIDTSNNSNSSDDDLILDEWT